MSEKKRGFREPRWSRTQARRELASFRSSGLSQRAWCEERGVSFSRLRYWAQQLEVSSEQDTTISMPSMVAVRVQDESAAAEMESSIELEVEGLFVLRIPPEFARSTLSAVVGLLKRRMAC